MTAAATSLISEAWDVASGWMDAGAEETILEAAVEPSVMPQVSLPPQELTSSPPKDDAFEEPFDLPHAPSEMPLNRIRDKLRAIRQRATAAGILVRANEAGSSPVAEDVQTTVVSNDNHSVSEPPASSVPAVSVSDVPEFQIPQGPREERLAAFASWARQVLHEHGGHVLVMSDEGEVLWGGDAKAGLLLSTMMAWSAAIRSNAVSACGQATVFRQPLASGNVLTVIPCETTAGTIHAAVAAPAPLSDEVAALLRNALCATLPL